MGCGQSTGTASATTIVPVTPAEDELCVNAKTAMVPVGLTPADSLELPTTDMNVVLQREGTDVVCKVDGVRRPVVERILYDDYWCFMRFPDVGRGGRIVRNKSLPEILSKVRGIAEGTSCQVYINDHISLELDIPGDYQRGQRVKATENIHISEGELVVPKGSHGTVTGPVNQRINVKWDERLDGKQKKISVLPKEVKLSSDLPEGYLRGCKVKKICNNTATDLLGVVTGPAQSFLSVMVWWDTSAAPESVLCSDVMIVQPM
eukprot:TRINITY_DN37138_c0_g1_i1.p1 TRINITY_DN37138_c0_g1~~TRINITY_DN37138_c0_g1_i1.p1  ORF type:complete len:272 (+),score=36.43 TRINITY_DN37138_c0_g1_i1:32-817(+)